MAYTVGEMARRLGVPASTIRYYDKEGLLPFVGRSSGGIRVFTEKDFEWLRIIECLKKTGIARDLSRKGHTISARTAFRSATVTVSISKSAKKRINRALIF